MEQPQLIVSSMHNMQLYNSIGTTVNPSKKVIARERASAKNVHTIVYPIFEEAAKCTDDPFWKEILKGFAITGMYKRISSYRQSTNNPDIHGHIFFKQKTKNNSVAVTGDHIDVFNTVRDFLCKNANIISNQDKIIRHEDMISKQAQRQIINWSSVKSQLQKRDMIENYLYVQKLPKEQKKQLEEILFNGLHCKLFDTTDITIVNGKIEEISGIIVKDSNFSISEELFGKLIKSSK